MSESSVDEVLSAFADRERIPLRELGERLGMDRAARSRAVKAGVIRPAGREGLGGGYVIDQAEARRLIFAALKAAAAGIAIVTMLRALDAASK